MKYFRFGSNKEKISAIAFGCLGLLEKNKDNSISAIIQAWEKGVNFFDTADINYSDGQSELILKEALRKGAIPREKCIISTKCGIILPGQSKDYQYKAYDLSPKYIKSSCENSLKRLGVEYVDIYQPHRIDYLTHPEEIARALEDLIDEGKIRHVGISNYTIDEIRSLTQYIKVESLQTQFSLFHVDPLEKGLISVCLEKKMLLLCWSPLQKGLLTGKKKYIHNKLVMQRAVGVLAQLQEFSKKYNVTLAQLSLAWLMNLPDAVIPIVGTTNPKHIIECAKAVDIILDRDDWYELLMIARGKPIPELPQIGHSMTN